MIVLIRAPRLVQFPETIPGCSCNTVMIPLWTNLSAEFVGLGVGMSFKSNPPFVILRPPRYLAFPLQSLQEFLRRCHAFIKQWLGAGSAEIHGLLWKIEGDQVPCEESQTQRVDSASDQKVCIAVAVPDTLWRPRLFWFPVIDSISTYP